MKEYKYPARLKEFKNNTPSPHLGFKEELTAAGTVQDSHLIPFSFVPNFTPGTKPLRGKCNKSF
jgi:hypothetical protein